MTPCDAYTNGLNLISIELYWRWMRHQRLDSLTQYCWPYINLLSSQRTWLIYFSACPDYCVCSSMFYKLAVECRRANFTSIPSGIPKGIRELYVVSLVFVFLFTTIRNSRALSCTKLPLQGSSCKWMITSWSPDFFRLLYAIAKIAFTTAMIIAYLISKSAVQYIKHFTYHFT